MRVRADELHFKYIFVSRVTASSSEDPTQDNSDNVQTKFTYTHTGTHDTWTFT